MYDKDFVIAGSDPQSLTDTTPSSCAKSQDPLTEIPGLIDVHVHFRDPGFPTKETIETGLAAATAGGFTTVCCMPNTNPAISSIETLSYIDDKARKAGGANLFAVSAMTIGQKGNQLCDFEALDAAPTRCKELTGHGIAAISEDGKSLMDYGLMREVCIRAEKLGIPVMDHAEDHTLTGGSMNLGAVSKRLGEKGIPAQAEVNIVARDIRLAKETGVKMHIQHVSTKEALALIREAKKTLPNLTCETCPHYFTFTDEDVERLGAMAKMNPPLRTAEDREAVIEALRDGTIDIIATDHAPHELSEKRRPLAEAPFGISGLETAFAASYTALVVPGHLTLTELAEKMSKNPAKLINLPEKYIGKTYIDEKAEYEVDPKDFKSKGKNTPYAGEVLKGKVIYTIN
jgi:dihydroorotase